MPTTTINLTGQALSKTDDTNVTLTLTGTPLTALLKTVGITVGWTGTLAATRGGTGLSALGTAGQLLKVNAGGTALEYFTPSYGTGTVTSFAFTDSTGITSTVLNSTTTPTLSLSLTSAAVGLGNVENTALSTWAGSANITTLGTIGIGTWNAGQITSTTAFTAPALGGVGITCLSTFANTLNLNQSYFAGGFLGIKTDNFNEAAGVGYGLSGTFEASGSGTLSFMIGVEGGVVNSGSGAQPFATGVGSIIENTGSGSITVGYNFKVSDNQAVTKYGFFNDVAGVTNKFLSLDLGTASTVDGTLVLYNSANAFTTTLKTGVTGASYTLTLPTSDGASGEFLQTNGSGVLTWAAAGGGITAGTTTASGTSGDVLMNIGGVVGSATATVNRAYRLDVGTPFNSFFNFGAGQAVGYNNTTALRNSSFSYNALSALTTGDDNTCFGYQSGIFITTQNNNTYFGSSAGQNTGSNNTGVGYLANNGGSASSNTAIGYSSMSAGTTSGTGNNAAIGASSLFNATSGIRNTALGAESLFTLTSGSYNVAIGFEACYTGNLSGTIGIGYFANPTTPNTGVIGSNQSESRLDAIYFNSPTSSGGSIYDIILSGSGGSGSNAASANMSLQGGAPTGTSTIGGALNLRGYTALGSGSTAQTATTVLQITNATTVTVSNAVNFVFNATTGTKLGTATTQKLGFWNTTPIVQPTTAVAAATVASPGGGVTIKTDDTFDGYTLQQVVKALRNIGLLQ